MLRNTLLCRQNLQVCHGTYGDTQLLHYLSGFVYRGRKSLRTTGLEYVGTTVARELDEWSSTTPLPIRKKIGLILIVF
jgi:hypothetical protein